MMPLVSIVIPCYNQVEYIAETVNSAILQSYENIEVVLINDGSTDNTASIAKNISAQFGNVKYYEIPNGGVAKARNYGISVAKGEYILLLDSDDIIGEKYIEEAIAIFIKEPSTSLVYCNAKLFGASNANWNLPAYSFKELLRHNVIFISAVFPKQLWQESVGFRSNLRFEDWDFWLSILDENSKVHKLEPVHFHYRIRVSSRLQTTLKLNTNEELLKVFLNHQMKYTRNGYDPISLISDYQNIKESLAYILGNILLKPYNSGNWRQLYIKVKSKFSA